MRPGINAIQETLTPNAASVIRAAYAEARRRRHSTLAPLHVAAMLILTPSPGCSLRRACIESHKEFAHPLQCRALELCFKVAMESKPANMENSRNPSISNALVAALKRAQAQQRRGTPEQSLQPLLAVKVEMEQLIISLLDDPSVSKIFKEAKFDSTAVKFYMEEVAAQASAAGSSSSLDNTSQLLRRGRLPMSPFPACPMESVQFRQSLFSSSSPFAADPSSDQGGLVDRGRMNSSILEMQAQRGNSSGGPSHWQEADAQAFSPTPSFLETAALQQKQARMSPMVPRPMDASSFLNPGQVIRNLVDVLLRDGKKRNPVLVSDLGSSTNFVTKEFTQLVRRGDVPGLLQGIQILTLPVNSLSVGLLTKEETVQKLAELRTTLEGCIMGGAIIFLGDLLWLVEAAQSDSAPATAAHLVLQELEHLMSFHAKNRLWFLSSASTQTFLRCQSNDPSLESQWGLLPIMVVPNGGAALHQRYGSYQLGFGNASALKGSGFEKDLEISHCCLECTRAFKEECSVLIKEERAAPGSSGMELNGGLLSLNTQQSHQPWLQHQKDVNRVLLPVKEEKQLLTQKVQELRHKYHQLCSSHHHQLQSGSLTSVSSASVRDASSSPVSEITSLPQEISSRIMQHPLLSANMSSKWVPEPVKTLAAKSVELSPHHAAVTEGNVPHFLMGRSANREIVRSGASSVDRSVFPLDMTRRDGTAGTSLKPNLTSAKAGNMVGTDLALGRVLPGQNSRDLREDGQQPLLCGWQLPRTSKFEPWQETRSPLSRQVVETVSSLPSAGPNPALGMVRQCDAEGLNGLCRSLGSLVPWQKQAITAVASAVVERRSGEGRRRGLNSKSDTWLLLLGPDRVGKRAVAKALAEVVYGSEQKLIRTEFRGVGSSSWGFQAASAVNQRGKTPLDRLVDDVKANPFSVLLLEDVDQVDPVVRKSLLRAMDRGKLADSRGREVSLANAIVIMTCGAGASLLTNDRVLGGRSLIDFDEEKLLGLGPRGVRLLVGDRISEKVVHRKGARLSVVERKSVSDGKEAVERTPESILLFGSPMFKRKALPSTSDEGHHLTEKRCKREASSSSKGLSLDLNLSAEENASEEVEGPCTTEDVPRERPVLESEEVTKAKVIHCACESLPKELFDLLDAVVVFKPFDFHDLADWVLEKLDEALQNTVTTRAPVEIDVALLRQMVASAWQTFPDQDAFQGWVDTVFARSAAELLEDRSTVLVNPESVVRFVLEKDMAPEFTLSSSAGRPGLLPTVIQVDR